MLQASSQEAPEGKTFPAQEYYRAGAQSPTVGTLLKASTVWIEGKMWWGMGQLQSSDQE